VLAVAVGVFALLRRCASPAETEYAEPEYSRPENAEREQKAALPVTSPAITSPAVTGLPRPEPAVAASVAKPIAVPHEPASAATPANANRARGQIDFQPVAMRLSLVYATLQFRMMLTAGTEFPPGRVFGDMISAHGSLPQSHQLFPAVEKLALMHTFSRLSPGQTLEVKGEIRLPLNAIRPVQQGGASFMVPLVRVALLGDNEPGLPHLELGCAFTIGLLTGGPALAPLRLDTGPRDFTGLSGREIEAARRTSLIAADISADRGLDPARAAG